MASIPPSNYVHLDPWRPPTTGAQAHAATRRLQVLLRSGVESRLGLVVGPSDRHLISVARALALFCTTADLFSEVTEFDSSDFCAFAALIPQSVRVS